MKHRLLEFLVEELGFTVFSIEANMPESFRINDYVLRGQGDPRELIRVMGFWIWATEEVREMVEWMRRHNAEAEHRERRPPVTFTGFDVQNPDVAAKIVMGFVEKADPGYAPAVHEAARAAAAAGRSRRRPGPGNGLGDASGRARARQEALVPGLDQDGGPPGRLRGTLVALRRGAGGPKSRYDAGPTAAGHDRLAALRDRDGRARRDDQHQLRCADDGAGQGVVRRARDRARWRARDRPVVRS